MSISESSKPAVAAEERLSQLEAALREHNIPVEQWTGEKGTKTVRDLFNELEAGETEFEFSEDGSILRVVNTIGGDVAYLDEESGMLYRLKEDRQVSKIDGNVKRRPELRAAVAEKMKSGESPAEAALRGIREELGIAGAFDVGPEELIVDKRKTETYPGLNSEYRIHKIPVKIDAVSYRPEGYIEDQPTKTTYFVWERAES